MGSALEGVDTVGRPCVVCPGEQTPPDLEVTCLASCSVPVVPFVGSLNEACVLSCVCRRTSLLKSAFSVKLSVNCINRVGSPGDLQESA